MIGLLAALNFNAVQLPDTQNFVVTKWGMESGLPQSSVNDIIQTQDGYIWLATFGGLVRFDGVSFTTFNRSNTPGMRSDRILHMYEDSSGIIWLSTEDGFLKFDQGVVTPYMFYIDNQVYSTSRIREDGHGNLWIVVYRDIYVYTEDGFKKIELSQDESLIDPALNDPNGAWLLYDKKIMRTFGNEQVVEIMDLEDRVTHNFVDFIEYPEGSGIYFMASTHEGVLRYKDGNLTRFSEVSDFPARNTRRFEKDLQGNLWVVNFLGLYIWNGETFVPGPSILDFETTHYLSVLEDNEGNYWFGSNNDGLTRLRPAVIRTISDAQGLDFDPMLSLTQLKNGTKVFATNCGGLYEFNNGRSKPSAINDYLPNQCVWSVFEDSQGRIWFGSREFYRSSSLDEPGIIIGPEMGFNGLDIFAITEDSKGRIWIGAFNGIYIYENGEFTSFTTRDGLTSNDTRALFEDNNGTMWAGTSNGLNAIRDGIVEQIPLLETQSDIDENRQPYVRAIYQDSTGVMWFGTYGNGIFRLQNGTITNISTNDGLFDDIISHIVEDDDGYFWMGSNRGISRVSRNELVAFTNGEINSVTSVSYGTADGMLSPETNGGFQPSVIKGSDNKIYFPTIKGVAVVDLNAVSSDIITPRIYIERARTGNLAHSLTETINLPHDNAFIEIDFTALSFSDPENIRFRYKLEALDQDWFDVGNRRTALYTKIPSGEYRFVVTASNGNNVWDEVGASLLITVVPPFWNRPWFYGLLFLSLVSGIFMIYYRRLHLLQRANEQKTRFTQQLIESQEKERRRIASDLHDGLGQQLMIIKSRAEMAQMFQNNADELKSQLQSIIDSSKISITDIRNISHALRPVHLENFGLTNAIINLCDRLKTTNDISWTYEIDDIDEAIPKEQDINIYRVIQEAVSNIQKHSKAKEASVLVYLEHNGVRVTITDNGNGSYKAQSSYGGLGIIGMTERINTIGGTIQITSEPKSGTEIKIFIPKIKDE